ncbi:MAG: polysaccharide deacetylase family protein [Clostridia bacterium]|nr:polysaccharide deacetylase family protein [Clostridia bacterium]
MKRRTRIISLILSLALIFGCLPLTLFAADVVPEELTGGEITEEDVAAGETDALTSKIPTANGILSIDELKDLVTLIKSNTADTRPTPGSTWNTIGNVRVNSDGGRTYRTVGAPDADLLAAITSSTKPQIAENLTNDFSGISSITHKDVATYKGASFVVSFDLRLDENFSSNLATMNLYSYANVTSSTDPTIKSYSTATLTVLANGKLYIPKNGSERPAKNLDYTLPKSTVAEDGTVTKAPFTTLAVHVNPKANTYDVYANGVSVAKDIVFLTAEQQALIAAIDEGETYPYNNKNYTSSYDFTETDYVLGMARMFAHYSSSSNPFLMNLTGDIYSYDNLKLYYSDLYLECSEHDIEVAEHTHDEENLTASANFTCKNCGGKWNVTVPMDQTGNALCDLCEINNANSDSVGTFHSMDEVISFIKTSVGNVTMNDEGTVFGNYQQYLKSATENGNTYSVIGESTNEFFGTLTVSDTSNAAKTLSQFATTPYKGKSFVVQADVRLGSGFKTENQGFELFKIFTYCTDSNTTNTALDSLYKVHATISNSGELKIRNGATGSNETVCSLSTDKFTSIALHVKTADAADVNSCGLFDVYVDGELKRANVQYLTATEEALLHVDATVNGTAIKIDGIKDYCYAFTRLFHNYGGTSIPTADVLHIDNCLSYFADEYVDDYTQHEMFSEHVHDYSENCTTYGSYCTLCGAGDGGVAILDKNGDKLCDICVNEQIDTTADGIIDPADLKDLIGASNVVISSTITETSPFGFSSVANSAGCITTKTENGNTYIQYIGKQATGESYVNLNTSVSGSSGTLNNFNNNKGYNGKSYVFSMDIRLGTEFNQSVNLSQTLCYMVPDAKNEAGQPTSFKSLNQVFTIVNSAGQLQYRVAGETSSSYKIVPNFTLEKGAEKFTTIAMHVQPTKGDYGLYSIYIDGKCVVPDIPFLTKTESDSMTWTMANGKSSQGAKDFTLGFIRSCPLFPGATLASTVTDFLSLDNPKLYYSDKFIECAEHKFTMSEHTHDLENGEIVIELTCPCGECDEIRLPIDTVGNGKCDTCGAYLLSGGAEVTGRQVILGDLIKLKLFAKIHSDLVNDPTVKVIVTYGENTYEFIPSEMTKNENGEYEFDVQLTSVEMSTDVSVALEVDGELGNAYTTNVRDYAMSLLETSESEYEKELCRAMLNYGAYAQKYFAEKRGDASVAESLANALLDEKYTDVSYVTESTLAAHAFSTSGVENGAAFTGATLILDTDTTLKIFFTAPADAEVAVDGNAVTPNAYGHEYFVEIGGLLPQHLDDAFTVAITVDGKTVTSEISVLTAVHALLISGESDSFKALGKAIYLYNLAAVMYTAEKSEAQVVVKDDAKGAVALVLDDGTVEAADYAASYMQKYDKVNVTFALNTKNYATFAKDSEGNYVMSEDGKFTYTQTDAQKLAANYWYNLLATKDVNGNELAPRVELISHSHTHNNPTDGNLYAELLGSRHILEGLFGYDSPAFIAPGGFDNMEGYDDVKMETFIASRGTNASVNAVAMLNTLSEFDKDKRKRLDSFMIQYNRMWTYVNEEGKEVFPDNIDISLDDLLKLDENGKADVSHVEKFIDAAMENGALAGFCIHGIVPYESTSTSTLKTYDEQADAIFEYVQKKAETGELWSTTYSEAVIYFCEWNTSTLDVRKINDGMLAVSLTDEEDDNIFDMALTVKVSVDDSWTSVVAAQGSETEVLEVMGEAGAKYVLVNVLPDSGIVTLTKA